MEKLKTDFADGYKLIKEYFYSDRKMTYPILAAKYGLTVDIVRYRIHIAKNILKRYIVMHENGC